jgi:hypothetical protein
MYNKYTVEQVAEIIESEGLGYAIQEYTPANRIEDPILAGLWAQAQDALDAVEKYVGDHADLADDES